MRSAFHGTRKWPRTGNPDTHTCTPWCFWILSVRLSDIRKRTRVTKQVCLKQESPSPSVTFHIDFSCTNSPQQFCHCDLKFHVRFAVVNNIQGSAESSPNVRLCSLQCSPIIDGKEFIDLQFKNFKLHMHFRLRRHQTALGAETSCWSCLLSSCPSSIS